MQGVCKGNAQVLMETVTGDQVSSCFNGLFQAALEQRGRCAEKTFATEQRLASNTSRSGQQLKRDWMAIVNTGFTFLPSSDMCAAFICTVEIKLDVSPRSSEIMLCQAE